MTEPEKPRYAERMFPAPTDHGIAREDRAVSSVRNGTDVEEIGGAETELWYQGGGRVGEKPVESVVVYPPTRGVRSQGDPWEPVKMGILIDMDNGQLIYDWINATILAVEDALNEGVYDRPVEIRVVDARGLRCRSRGHVGHRHTRAHQLDHPTDQLRGLARARAGVDEQRLAE